MAVHDFGEMSEGQLDGLGDLPDLVEFIAGVPFKLTAAGIAAFKKARPDVTVTR